MLLDSQAVLGAFAFFAGVALALAGASALCLALHRAILTSIALWRPRETHTTTARPARFVALVPAHDEALLIADTVRSIQRAHHPAGTVHVVVIADNCTDDTAANARVAGATVLERRDPANPGKGQALAFGLSQLDLSRYDAVAVFDADNDVDPGFFAAMSDRLGRGERCLQGYYDIANPHESALTRLMSITHVLKCEFHLVGRARLGASVSLLGTGMVFAREVVERLGWQAGSIAEDLEQALLLLERGERIRYVAQARTRAQESVSLAQAFPQRQRWATGKSALQARARRLAWRALLAKDWHRFEAALDFLLPSYSRLLAATVGLAAGAFALRDHTYGAIALTLALSAAGLQAAEIALALVRMRAGAGDLLSLALAPVYLVWKLCIDALAAFRFREGRWTRTARIAREPGSGRT